MILIKTATTIRPSGHQYHQGGSAAGVATTTTTGSGAGAATTTTAGGGSGSFGSSSALQRVQCISPSGFGSPHSGHTLLPTRWRPPTPGKRRSVASLLVPGRVVGMPEDTQNRG